MKEENKNYQRRIILFVIISLVTFLQLWRIMEADMEINEIIFISLGFSLVVNIIIYFLEKMGIIKNKTKEQKEKEKEEKLLEKERVNLEKEEIDKRNFKNLISDIEKEESKLEYMRGSLSKRKEYGDSDWVMNFVYFGFVVFFIGLLFFGTLDGKYIDKEIYLGNLSSALDIGEGAFNDVTITLLESFEKLVIKFYEVGSENKIVFSILWYVAIIWWIGYMFIYGMLKTSKWTIKELLFPIIKKARTNYNEKHKNNNNRE